MEADTESVTESDTGTGDSAESEDDGNDDIIVA